MDSEESKETSSSLKSNDESIDKGRRSFIKVIGAGIVGAAAATAIEYPVINSQVTQISDLNSRVTSLNNQVTSLNGQVTGLNSQIQELNLQLSMDKGFVTLGFDEQVIVEAIVETIIPSETGSPGGKEAGVIYFIDRQLSGDYGKNSSMYMNPPFVLPGQSGPITVDGITYPQGTPSVPYHAGQQYQYSIQLREFWRIGLKATQDYSQQAYGAKFEIMANDQRLQVLRDLFDNKPTNFEDIIPRDFFSELVFMTWSGFLMDPLYGGNNEMLGWKHVGFNGLNYGELYGENLHVRDLMVANKPTRLQPVSIGQWHKIVNLPGGGEGGTQ